MKSKNLNLIKKWTAAGYMPVGISDGSALKLAQSYEFGLQLICEMAIYQPMIYTELLKQHFPYVVYNLRHKINDVNDLRNVIDALTNFLNNYVPSSDKNFIQDQIKGHFFPLFD